MEIVPQILTAKVMHKRLFPKVNAFTYRVYYLAMPLPAVPLPSVIQRFPKKDLGYRDGRCPEAWAREILDRYALSGKIAYIMLVTMPQVLGHVFNPVSFYLCLDDQKQLCSVISEVHNTFGEQHSYLCAHKDQRPIEAGEWLEAEKLFHVSPFLERNGKYRFRFDVQETALGIWIDYYDEENNKKLLTSLVGTLAPLDRHSLAKAFWKHPLITLKAILLIHWQAVKLVLKALRYIPKPKACTEKLTVSSDLTKM
jgi:uncharacterized protein